jgi:hypothetical protein
MPASLFADLPWHVLVAVPLIVLAGYTVFGATGFGSSIIIVPALAHWFALTAIVPLFTALDCAATVNASFRQWRRAQWAEIRHIVPPMLLGIAAGALLLFNLPRAPALLALGVFVAAYGAYLLLGRREWRAAHPAWAWPAGLLGGVFSVLFGTGGPLYMIYLSARIHDKTVLRATSSVIVTMSVLVRTVLFVATGLLLDAPLLVAAALLLPLMLAGYALGNRLHFALSRAGVLRAIAVLLVGNGAWLAARAVALLRDD